jgi:hypothetical protein
VTPTNELLYDTSAKIEATFGASQTVKVQQFDLSSDRMLSESTLAV